MDSWIDNVPLHPWQATVITWLEAATIVLFFAMLVMMVLRFKKKTLEERFDPALCWTLVAFVVTLTASAAVMTSFLVDVELGWKSGLIAGAAAIVLASSLIKLLILGFTDTPRGRFLVWLVLAMISFAIMAGLFLTSVQKAQG